MLPRATRAAHPMLPRLPWSHLPPSPTYLLSAGALVATIVPAVATYQKVKWLVEGDMKRLEGDLLKAVKKTMYAQNCSETEGRHGLERLRYAIQLPAGLLQLLSLMTYPCFVIQPNHSPRASPCADLPCCCVSSSMSHGSCGTVVITVVQWIIS